jgi:hypothetical protein
MVYKLHKVSLETIEEGYESERYMILDSSIVDKINTLLSSRHTHPVKLHLNGCGGHALRGIEECWESLYECDISMVDNTTIIDLKSQST